MTRQRVHIARRMRRHLSRYLVDLKSIVSDPRQNAPLRFEHTVRIVSAIVVIIAFAVLRAMATL